MKNKKCGGFGSKKGSCGNEVKFPNKSPYCSNCAGESFEYHIARLFEIQGCEVKRNIKNFSTQTDFFAKHKHGFIKAGILVECKWKFNEKDTVKGDEVRIFNSSWELFNKSGTYGLADKAFLVTNGRFSPEAIEMAKNLNIELWTENDLIGQLIDFRPYLSNLIDEYTKSNLPGHYIELNSTSGVELSEDIKTILFEDDSNSLVILGDYGCGKTSVCLKICYDFALRIMNGDSSAPLPIYIKLRKYNKAVDIESLITNLLVNECRIQNANIITFKEFLLYSNTILIFDGFDEIAKRVDSSVKYEVLSEITKFVSDRTKVLITCRPNFFNQRQEFENIFKSSPIHFEPNLKTVFFEEVEIADLSVKQIKDYIGSYEKELLKKGFNFVDFLKVLDDVHDLWDLAKRPVLLNIIIDTVPKLDIKTHGKINAATLYEQYTNNWLQREDSKGKTLINSDKKLLFTRELAREMFAKNELSIHFNDLPKVVKKYFNITESDSIDYFSHDIQTCSFLHTEGNGNFKFIHKSFMEYFVAFQILFELYEVRSATLKKKVQEINRLLGECLITLEIGLFIKDILESGKFIGSDFILIDIDVFNKLSQISQKNIISIISKLDFKNSTSKSILDYFNNIDDYEGVDLSSIFLENIILENKYFNSACFFKANLRNVKFKNCSFLNTNFKKAELRNIYAENLMFEYSDFSKSQIDHCSFKGSNLAYCNFNNSQIKRTDFDSAELTEISYKDTELAGCKNIDTTIGAPYLFG